MRSVVRAATLAAVVLAACDKDESVQDKCETLVRTYCDTVTTCAANADLLDASYSTEELFADCEQTVSAGAHCEDAERVTSKYDDCLEAASAELDCRESNASLLNEQTFEIPSVCRGVVGY